MSYPCFGPNRPAAGVGRPAGPHWEAVPAVAVDVSQGVERNDLRRDPHRLLAARLQLHMPCERATPQPCALSVSTTTSFRPTRIQLTSHAGSLPQPVAPCPTERSRTRSGEWWRPSLPSGSLRQTLVGWLRNPTRSFERRSH